MNMTEPKEEVIVVWFLQENSDTSINITTDLPSNCKRKITQTQATQPKKKDMFRPIEKYNKEHGEEKESIDKNEKHEESYVIEIY